jgi:predicted lipase
VPVTPTTGFVLSSSFVSRSIFLVQASQRRRTRRFLSCRYCRVVSLGLRSKISAAIVHRVTRALGDRRLAAGKAAATGGQEDDEDDDSPPPGLMLGALLSEMQQLAAGDVSGRLGSFMTASKERVRGGTTAKDAFSGDAEDMLSGKLGEVTVLSEGDATSALGKLQEIVSRGGGQAVGAAVATAMQAVGIGADDDDDDLEEDVGTPSEPAFDAVTALILAGYGFQAYLSPPRGAYWETYIAAVPGSVMSERIKQSVRTRVAYPSTETVSRSARGVFMVHVEALEGADGVKPLESKFFVSALLNDMALHNGNAFQSGRTDFSLLKRIRKARGEETGSDNCVDTLTFGVYESEAAFDSGGSLLAIATMSLQDLVADAEGKPGGARGDPQLVTFSVPSAENAEDNFFETDILPEGMRLPFAMPSLKSRDSREKYKLAVEGAAMSVQVSYVPFDMPAGYELDEDEEDNEEDDVGSDEITADEVSEISETMKDGDMPLDWQKLAKTLHDTVERLEEASRFASANLVREDMPKARFISSPDTDTEVWLWHDPKKRHVVVSYRGTEQTKWKDFVTDSLVFLQTWTPGDAINLDIEAGRTMGLDIWDVVLNGSKKGMEDDVSAMSCCHWGFLRAYLSLRDSVDHTLAELTDNFSHGYTYFFTGHSLGGALATLSAADTQARRGSGEAPLDIVMMNFGSPRVGNRGFCRAYNALVPNSFRVVNGADLVARMPQTPARLRGGFRHVGRTVLVEENGDVWVQGEDGDGGSDAFPEPDMAKLDGLLARERQMWSLLISGKSLGHHMEDSYFLAMKGAVEKLLA